MARHNRVTTSSNKEHKSPKQPRQNSQKSSPCTYATPPEPKHTSPGLVHAHQQKPVTPISKTGPTGFLQQLTPKSQKCKNKCTSSPLTVGIGSRDAMQLFSTFLSPPCCQCMNQGSKWKICNLELLKYTKCITRCYTCPNEQVRYSTAS
jgi:hypothetical protein